MRHALIVVSACLALAACSTDTNDSGSNTSGLDSGAGAPGDLGTAPEDSGVAADTGVAPDSGVNPDAMSTPDTGANCQDGLLCGGECVDVMTSEEHCGRCDNACGANESCENGSCACETTCGGACVDVFSDAAHCGQCNMACGAGESCLAGVCAARFPGIPGEVAAMTVSATTSSCAASNDLLAATASQIAVDLQGRAYIAMRCDDQVLVTTSTTWGGTYSTPLDTLLPSVRLMKIAAGAPGQAFVVATTPTNVMVFTRTMDGGDTWSAPRIIDGGPIGTGLGSEPSIALYQNNLYIGIQSSSRARLRIWRSRDLGAGAFDSVEVQTPSASQVMVDPEDGTLWVAGSDGSATIRFSTDGGDTFQGRGMVPTTILLGNYAYHDGFIYVISGTQLVNTDPAIGRYQTPNGPFEFLSLANYPGVEVRGAPSGRMVAAAPNGDIYFNGSRLFGMEGHRLSMFRVVAGSVEASAEREVGVRPRIDSNMSFSLGFGGDTVAITYAEGSEIKAGVLAF